MRIVTLSFDDGFYLSSLKTAEIYEKFGLKAEFNVVVKSSIESKFKSESMFGGFSLWNELNSRGHYIQPHGFDHSDKGNIPFEDAKQKINKCLDCFKENLNGFNPEKTIFNFPFNSSNCEIEDWLKTRVLGFRTKGSVFNDFPIAGIFRFTTDTAEDAENALNVEIEKLLNVDDRWLLYTLHGLDGQGWGPVKSSYLENLLDRLLSMDVQILTVKQVIELYA